MGAIRKSHFSNGYVEKVMDGFFNTLPVLRMREFTTWKRTEPGLALVILKLPGGIPVARQADSGAILAVMQQAFDAVRSQNPDDWRAIQLAEGTSLQASREKSRRRFLLAEEVNQCDFRRT